uniref:C-type lectin domain-containing protein n=1 Tax=Monopterus albus TaxID=43700 RepID=A0A3Q3JP52_MONAL
MLKMRLGRMHWMALQLLILATLSCLFLAEDELEVIISCPEYQKAFGDSCYEFVGLPLSFLSCDDSLWRPLTGKAESDFHIQYLMNIQYVQQWIVLSSGPLSWLDGSPITYSNWVRTPQPGAACGHILRDTGFKWQATKDCNKKLHFICQYGMYSDSNSVKTKKEQQTLYRMSNVLFYSS